MVERGYMVRARTDNPNYGNARAGDVTQRDSVIASGAQVVSTDYPVGEPYVARNGEPETCFVVGLDQNPRCSPANVEGCPASPPGPVGCTAPSTDAPTAPPTTAPTEAPVTAPTAAPTKAPTPAPTTQNTGAPWYDNTWAPTAAPVADTSGAAGAGAAAAAGVAAVATAAALLGLF
mmetsp:Transcript_41654/g.132975  ORF Transcript_41654/g.132975 Transcript_41654/m.132975 type:complete len:176 (-) Transcript_41654:9-536(-)